jgi:hypothetical protein
MKAQTERMYTQMGRGFAGIFSGNGAAGGVVVPVVGGAE